METRMSDDFYRTHRSRDKADTMARLRAYLHSRPRESWLFFIAGALVGAILG